MLIRPPTHSLTDVLVLHLRKGSRFVSFRFAVAWARKGGVERIAPDLKAYSGKKVGIVGLNQRNTSYEALYLLREMLDDLFVFYKHPRQVFHPKLYFFAGNPQAATPQSVLVIGSSNLTSAGLESNFEASWLTMLDPRVIQDHESLSQIEGFFNDLLASGFCHRVNSVDYLDELLVARYISTEKELSERSRREMELAGRLVSRSLLPIAPPPRPKKVEFLPVPAPAEGISEEVPQGPLSNTLFYVRTLTPNDVRKALGLTPGTWEPDLGLGAINEHRDFWGWPDKYTKVSAARVEWRATAIYYSRSAPGGVRGDLVFWYRPERPDHLAEHRFRPPASIKAIVPPSFDTEALVVIQRLPAGRDVDFRVDFILHDDPDYSDYDKWAANQKPRHRAGYGEHSSLAD